MSMFIIITLASLIGAPADEIQRRKAQYKLYRKHTRHFEREVLP